MGRMDANHVRTEMASPIIRVKLHERRQSPNPKNLAPVKSSRPLPYTKTIILKVTSTPSKTNLVYVPGTISCPPTPKLRCSLSEETQATKKKGLGAMNALPLAPSEEDRERPRGDPRPPETLPGEVQPPGGEHQPGPNARQVP